MTGRMMALGFVDYAPGAKESDIEEWYRMCAEFEREKKERANNGTEEVHLSDLRA